MASNANLLVQLRKPKKGVKAMVLLGKEDAVDKNNRHGLPLTNAEYTNRNYGAGESAVAVKVKLLKQTDHGWTVKLLNKRHGISGIMNTGTQPLHASHDNNKVLHTQLFEPRIDEVNEHVLQRRMPQPPAPTAQQAQQALQIKQAADVAAQSVIRKGSTVSKRTQMISDLIDEMPKLINHINDTLIDAFNETLPVDTDKTIRKSIKVGKQVSALLLNGSIDKDLILKNGKTAPMLLNELKEGIDMLLDEKSRAEKASASSASAPARRRSGGNKHNTRRYKSKRKRARPKKKHRLTRKSHKATAKAKAKVKASLNKRRTTRRNLPLHSRCQKRKAGSGATTHRKTRRA